MAKSLSLGLMIGVCPLFVPFCHTASASLLAKLFNWSVPATLIGMGTATPFWFLGLLPFVRAGELLGGKEFLDFHVMKTTLHGGPILVIKTFTERKSCWPSLFGSSFRQSS